MIRRWMILLTVFVSAGVARTDDLRQELSVRIEALKDEIRESGVKKLTATSDEMRSVHDLLKKTLDAHIALLQEKQDLIQKGPEALRRFDRERLLAAEAALGRARLAVTARENQHAWNELPKDLAKAVAEAGEELQPVARTVAQSRRQAADEWRDVAEGCLAAKPWDKILDDLCEARCADDEAALAAEIFAIRRKEAQFIERARATGRKDLRDQADTLRAKNDVYVSLRKKDVAQAKKTRDTAAKREAAERALETDL